MEFVREYRRPFLGARNIILQEITGEKIINMEDKLFREKDVILWKH